MNVMLGNAELGRILGVSRQRVSQITTTADFPPPQFTLMMGSVWALADVQAWADRKGRTLDSDFLQELTTLQPRSKNKPS